MFVVMTNVMIQCERFLLNVIVYSFVMQVMATVRRCRAVLVLDAVHAMQDIYRMQRLDSVMDVCSAGQYAAAGDSTCSSCCTSGTDFSFANAGPCTPCLL